MKARETNESQQGYTPEQIDSLMRRWEGKDKELQVFLDVLKEYGREVWRINAAREDLFRLTPEEREAALHEAMDPKLERKLQEAVTRLHQNVDEVCLLPNATRPQIDLRGVDLQGKGRDWKYCYLHQADLSHAILVGANLDHVWGIGADLSHAGLNFAIIKDSMLFFAHRFHSGGKHPRPSTSLWDTGIVSRKPSITFRAAAMVSGHAASPRLITPCVSRASDS